MQTNMKEKIEKSIKEKIREKISARELTIEWVDNDSKISIFPILVENNKVLYYHLSVTDSKKKYHFIINESNAILIDSSRRVVINRRLWFFNFDTLVNIIKSLGVKKSIDKIQEEISQL